MRSLYFTAAESGMTRGQLRHGESTGLWVRLGRGMYRFGSDPATELDRCLGPLAACNGVAGGALAGVLHGLDSVELAGPDTSRPVGTSNSRRGSRRRALLGKVVVVGGFACASGLQTLADLAAVLDDLRWEQALESALRKRLVSIDELEQLLPGLGRRARRGRCACGGCWRCDR